MVAAERLTQEIFLARGTEGSGWKMWGCSLEGEEVKTEYSTRETSTNDSPTA